MLLALWLLACKEGPAVDTAPFESGLDAAQLRRALAMSPPGPVPADPTNRVADDPDAAIFGQMLYFETRLSGNNRVSCATCHPPDHGFADPEPLSTGISLTGRHAPHVTDAAYNRWQFWDGRADSQWSQALGPLESEAEHGGSRLQYAHLIQGDDDLRQAYELVFGAMPDLSDPGRFPPTGRPVPGQPNHPYQLAWDGMSEADQRTISTIYANIGKSIAAYERLIVTGRAPLDDYVAALAAEDSEGLDALSEPAQRGLSLFVGDAGCHFCHSGPLLTDLEFHNIGLPNPEDATGADPGRYDGIATVLAAEFNGLSEYSDDPEYANIKLRNLYQGPEHYGQFKTPSLRNVGHTEPYMHDGRFATLEEVVTHYSDANTEPPVGHREEIVMPLDLSEEELADLVAFLTEALSGEPIPEALTHAP